jgi:hypothetical protein
MSIYIHFFSRKDVNIFWGWGKRERRETEYVTSTTTDTEPAKKLPAFHQCVHTSLPLEPILVLKFMLRHTWVSFSRSDNTVSNDKTINEMVTCLYL